MGVRFEGLKSSDQLHQKWEEKKLMHSSITTNIPTKLLCMIELIWMVSHPHHRHR